MSENYTNEVNQPQNIIEPTVEVKRKIGVECIYLDGQLVEDDTPCTTSFKLINSVCESHNEDIDDEAILKYNLFGEVVERAAEDYETEAEVLKKYKNKPGYVWSEWFG